MIVTITNLSTTKKLNALAVEDSGADLGTARVYATGGARSRPLPFPFGHVEIAASGTSILPVRPRDLRQREAGIGNGHGTHDAGEVWNQLVAMGFDAATGWLTFAQAAQAGRSDVEELFLAAL